MEATKTPLNQQVVDRIQAWLRTSESIEFRKLIVSLAAIEQVEALNDLRESDGDDGSREDALEKMEVVKKYYFMLHVLDSAALGNTPGKAGEKFPYVSIELNAQEFSNTISSLLNHETT